MRVDLINMPKERGEFTREKIIGRSVYEWLYMYSQKGEVVDCKYIS